MTITMIIKMVKRTLTPTIKFPTLPTQTIQIIKNTEDLDLSIHHVRLVVKLTIPHRISTLEQTQRIDHLPGLDDRKNKTKAHREMLEATKVGIFKLQPKL